MTAASEFYRREAAKLRETALSGLHSGEARWNLLEIANQYEVLARYSEFLRGDSPNRKIEMPTLVSKAV